MFAKIACAIRCVAYAAICALCLAGVTFIFGFAYPPEKVVQVPVTVEVPEGEFTMDDALRMADEMGVPRLMAKVLLRHEGGGRFSGDSRKCEYQSKEWMRRATDAAKLLLKQGKIKSWEFEEQRDAMRCSYGPGQVAGWWAPHFGGTWADLTNVKWSVWASFGVYKIKEREATTPRMTDLERYAAIFRAYNGSGPAAEAYTEKRMQELTIVLLEEAKRAGWLG